MNIGLKTLAVFAVAGAMMFSAGPALAAPGQNGALRHGGEHLTCSGGEIASGTYSDITVDGACSVAPGAVVAVWGNIIVKQGAALDGQSAASTITVGGNVTALPGAMLGLGCQPAAYVGNSGHACTVGDPAAHSTITVNGNVTALKAVAVLLNGMAVHGNITALGGGSDIPWSIKNNTVGHNITVSGQTTNWVGILFNKVGGNVTLLHVAVTDTDPGAHGAFVVQNDIRHNLICYGVTPTVTGGLYPGEPLNVVGGRALGQCAALA